MSKLNVRKTLLILAFMFVALFLLAGCDVESIANPYEGVDWSASRHVANFHAHTSESDGSRAPATVIDDYRNFPGRPYNILALSDHDFSKGVVTWRGQITVEIQRI